MKDHVMEISDDNRTVINVLSVMRNLVCTNGEETDRSLIDQHQVSMTSLLSSGGKAKSTQVKNLYIGHDLCAIDNKLFPLGNSHTQFKTSHLLATLQTKSLCY